MTTGDEGGKVEDGKTGNEAEGDSGKTDETISVSRTEHEKTQSDFQSMKAELAKMKKEQDESRRKALKDNQQWEELAKANEKRAAEAEAKLEKTQKVTADEKRFVAAKIAADKLGLLPEAAADLEELDLSALRIETTSTGKVNVLGATEFAERLKTIRPHWFKKPGAPSVETGAPRTHDDSGRVTIDAIIAAQKKAQETGDTKEYVRLVKEYQTKR